MSISVELDKVCDYATKISVYNDGFTCVYCASEEPYEKIIAGWKDLIKDAHDMPALV